MRFRDAWRALWQGEKKASAAAPLIALEAVGRPVWTPRRYDALAAEGYQKNVVAYRAINEVARGVASVPWRLYSGPGRRELSQHPLLRLVRRPNPAMGQSEFFAAVTGFFLIAGNSYVEAVGAPTPRELWPLRPDRMSVVPGRAGLPEAYEYRVGGVHKRWRADPVSGAAPILHLRAFHPLNDWYGLSPIEAAATAIDQRNEADRWNMGLLQNGARPSGAFVVRPDRDGQAHLSDEQFARAKEQLDQLYQGPRNAGRPLLLEGGVDWKELSLSPKDMDFLNAKHTSARDIASAFGVPPMLLGIPGDNTYSNYREARLALWEETIIPLLRHIRDDLNGWLTPMFEAGLELDLDLDEVPALILRRERKWAMLQAAEFLNLNEKRAAVGYGPIEGGDKLFGGAGTSPYENPEDKAS